MIVVFENLYTTSIRQMALTNISFEFFIQRPARAWKRQYQNTIGLGVLILFSRTI